MKKYKILIISDYEATKSMDDLYIAKSFKEDGNVVEIVKIGYEPRKDEEFDIILKRYTWPENIETDGYYEYKNNLLKNRICKRKKVIGINIYGFQETKYKYLATFTREKMPNVIPTINRIETIDYILRIHKTDKFIIRQIEDFVALYNKALHVKKDQLRQYFSEGGYLIQEDLKYKSEVQFHFVGNKLMYAFEYTPSKYSKLVNSRLINISPEDRKVAEKIAEISNLNYGLQRLDFIRLNNNELMLSEIRDTNFDMKLEKINLNIREKVIDEFKKNIYEFLELDRDTQERLMYDERYYYSI
ncbi:MAG: hypothetical protein IKF52_02980 [Clostridia bacterium]|nr:hypothetical protein [Clostridia bacterium]